MDVNQLKLRATGHQASVQNEEMHRVGQSAGDPEPSVKFVSVKLQINVAIRTRQADMISTCALAPPPPSETAAQVSCSRTGVLGINGTENWVKVMRVLPGTVPFRSALCGR